MPKIKVVEKFQTGKWITKVRTITYELPEQIVYKGEYLSYDINKEAYYNEREYITAADYLKEMLANSSELQTIDDEEKGLN